MDQGWVMWAIASLNVAVGVAAWVLMFLQRRLHQLWERRYVEQGERIAKLERQVRAQGSRP